MLAPLHFKSDYEGCLDFVKPLVFLSRPVLRNLQKILMLVEAAQILVSKLVLALKLDEGE